MKYALSTATVPDAVSEYTHVCTVACGPEHHPCQGTGCCYAFARPKDLERHVNVVHLHIRNFVCTWEGCGKRFGQKGGLKNHMNVHTGEHPHECEVCGERFTDPSPRTRHRWEQHGIKRGQVYASLSKQERMRGRKAPSTPKPLRSTRGVEAAQPKSKGKGKGKKSAIALPSPVLSPSPAPSLASSSSSSSSSDVDVGANALTAEDWACITSIASLPTLDTSFDSPALNAPLDISMFDGDYTLPSFDYASNFDSTTFAPSPDFSSTMCAPEPSFDPMMFAPSSDFDSTMFAPSPSFDPTMFAPLDCAAFPPDTFVAPKPMDTEAWMPTSMFQFPQTPRSFYNY